LGFGFWVLGLGVGFWALGSWCLTRRRRYDSGMWVRSKWRGVTAHKLPEDMWNYQVGGGEGGAVAWNRGRRHSSRVTRRTSHVTRHTSHVTRHTGNYQRSLPLNHPRSAPPPLPLPPNLYHAQCISMCSCLCVCVFQCVRVCVCVCVSMCSWVGVCFNVLVPFNTAFPYYSLVCGMGVRHCSSRI